MLFAEFRKNFGVNVTEVTWNEFYSYVVLLIQDAEHSPFGNRYLCRVSTDENTVRSITGVFEKSDKSWEKRNGQDTRFWQQERYLNSKQTTSTKVHDKLAGIYAALKGG